MFWFNGFEQNSLALNLIILAIVLWQIPWKGVALWKSAKRDHKIWFIVFLLVNTVGILEIIYIFFFSKPEAKKCWLGRLWDKIFKPKSTPTS